jgi:hypothetical protein
MPSLVTAIALWTGPAVLLLTALLATVFAAHPTAEVASAVQRQAAEPQCLAAPQPGEPDRD